MRRFLRVKYGLFIGHRRVDAVRRGPYDFIESCIESTQDEHEGVASLQVVRKTLVERIVVSCKHFHARGPEIEINEPTVLEAQRRWLEVPGLLISSRIFAWLEPTARAMIVCSCAMFGTNIRWRIIVGLELMHLPTAVGGTHVTYMLCVSRHML